MTTQNDLAVAAGHSVDLASWPGLLDELMARVAGRFSRVEPRRRARAFALGLLADLPRKNCWSIAEHAGDSSPDGMQHLLARAVWDADGVRDDVRDYVVEHLGDPGAVLVADETGDMKKGCCTAGVQRQYSGTAGRIENCQVAVYLTYASGTGHALIDRELYLPRSWSADRARCQAAGVPDEIVFTTKPGLALRMICRALDAGTPASWVAGDEVYGTDPGLRAGLEERQMGYVLAVARSHQVNAGAGMTRADALAARLPRSAWQQLSAGPGAKGHRYYDWAWISLSSGQPGHRWLLIRRHRRTGELAFHRCYAPRTVPLAALVTVAGRRWTVEEDFQAGKGLAGLDEHQVRRWVSWHRWVTMAMLASALLAVTAATERTHQPSADQIPLTRNETARILATIIIRPPHSTAHRLAWSSWRRRHQHRAQKCHYQRQARQL